MFHKLQHCGPEREAHVKDLSKALRSPSAHLTFIRYSGVTTSNELLQHNHWLCLFLSYVISVCGPRQENSMHLLVGLLTGSNAQCRLHAARCLHELSHSPHTSVAPACLPATPYLLTYLSGQSSKFTVSTYSYQAVCNITM